MAANMAKRPLSVTALLVLVLTFTGMQILRVWSALASWQYLNSLPLSVSPAYIVVSGLFWGLAGITLAWALWRRKAWAPWGARIVALVFALAYWADRLFLQAKGPQSGNEPFDLLLTALLLAVVFAALPLPRTRAYWRSAENN
jgi:hypothetical protein